MRDSFPACSGENPGRSRRIARGGALHKKGESNSSVMPPFQESPRCLSPFQRNLFALHYLGFHAEDRLPRRGSTPTTLARRTALWESLVGKPRGKATDPLIHATGSVTLLLPPWRKAHVHAPIRDEDLLPWGDSRGTHKVHVSTGEESSGSVPDSTQCLRTRHRRERYPERPPRNSHGDWPFLRPPERVP